MAKEIISGPKEDAPLQAGGEHKSHKKRKSSGIYTVIIAILICVMGFSGYKVITTVIRNKKAKDTYDDIINEFVVIIPDDTENGQTVPENESEHSGENETHASGSAADPTAAPSDPSKSGESRENGETGESGEVIVTIDEGSGAVTEAPATKTEQAATQAPAPAPTQAPQSDPLYNLSVDFTRLKNINKDVCAWLQGQGNIVNYPVVQGSDNSYYLKHLIDGSYNSNGTLFVHAQNHFLQDDITYIFGHHMYGGAMFGSLKKYDSSQYYWSHSDFKLYTPNKTYTLRIYAVFYGTGSDQITFNFSNEASFNKAMANYAARSLHTPQVNVSYGDKLVCLATCAYQVTDGRYFVLCKVMN